MVILKPFLSPKPTQLLEKRNCFDVRSHFDFSTNTFFLRHAFVRVCNIFQTNHSENNQAMCTATNHNLFTFCQLFFSNQLFLKLMIFPRIHGNMRLICRHIHLYISKSENQREESASKCLFSYEYLNISVNDGKVDTFTSTYFFSCKISCQRYVVMELLLFPDIQGDPFEYCQK